LSFSLSPNSDSDGKRATVLVGVMNNRNSRREREEALAFAWGRREVETLIRGNVLSHCRAEQIQIQLKSTRKS
jgi:hypothetical protein